MMHGFGFGLGGFFGMVLIWILLIAGAVWLIKSLFSGDSQKPSSETRREEKALDILNIRYARGELEKDEYEEMKRNLIS